MPVVRRSSSGSLSRRKARMPQWASRTPVLEEEVERAGEDRVADVAVQPRHGAGLDAVHAVAHDEVGAVLELLEEARDLAEVVGQVGVGHHDVAAAGGGEAGHVGVAVAAAALVDDAGAGGERERGGVVLGVVVGHDDLAADAVLGHAWCSAQVTQRSMFSASLRHGMTTLTSSSSSGGRGLRAPGREGARRCSWLDRARIGRCRDWLSPCASASSTTASSRTPSAAPSAGTATSPSGCAAEGHEVTYLTLRQWPRGADPGGVPGVRVVTAGPRLALYTRSGRRRIGPPLVFGAGVLVHLALRGRRYDVVHTASFPYFSLLAAGFLRRCGRLPAGRRLARAVDARVLARLPRAAGGWIGWRVQRACVRVPQRAFCFSRAARRAAARGGRCAARSRCCAGSYFAGVAT